MTTTRVTVPVEPTEAMIEAACLAAQDGIGCTPWKHASFDRDHGVSRQLTRDYVRRAVVAALSAAPAPEGGADAWRIRTKENLHGDGEPAGRWIVSNILSLSSDTAHWYEIQPLRVSEPSQADLETMEAYGVKAAALATRSDGKPEGGALDDLREALIQADLKIRSLPGTDQSDVEFIREALATREAGERDRVKRAIADGFSNGYEQYDDASEMQRLSYDMAADAVLALRAQPPAREDAQPVAWACKTCNSPRAVDPCQKCGTALTKPADGWEWPGLPDIDRIRRLAREVGYAVGVHGTMERDLDLIAAPWVAEAVGPAELAQHIADGLGGEVVNGDNQDKPCGRWSCNIHTPDWTKLIDLSVMPPAPDALRIASLSRFSPTSTGNNVAMMQEDEEGLYVLRKQVFAALKAEQKGGAA